VSLRSAIGGEVMPKADPPLADNPLGKTDPWFPRDDASRQIASSPDVKSGSSQWQNILKLYWL